MNEVKFNKVLEGAIERYPKLSTDEQSILETVYGKEVFTPKVVQERIRTFEDACNDQKVDIDQFEKDYGQLPDDVYAYMKLRVIVAALNEGWAPDWDNKNEYKYYAWFYRSSVPGFSFGGHGCDRGFSFVGSRLCYKSSELAKYAATQFVDIYETFFN